MCGRFALYSDPPTLVRRFGAEGSPRLPPRYNIAPTQNVLIVREDESRKRFALVRWGLIPGWAKTMETGYGMINARAETVADKPAFRSAFRHRRCLIPADGYYEWQAGPGAKFKQPWFITLRDREPMALAGLWERWRSPEGEELESCCIIVTAANPFSRPIHDRMPVILAAGDWEAWLAPRNRDAAGLRNLLQPYPAEDLAAWPVGTLVNNPRHESAACMEPAGAMAEDPAG